MNVSDAVACPNCGSHRVHWQDDTVTVATKVGSDQKPIYRRETIYVWLCLDCWHRWLR